MKKVILLMCFIVGVSQMATAQVDFGIKGGINYNSDAIKNFRDVEGEISANGKGKLGYHAGIWLRANIPVLGLYVRPELVYTALKNEITNLSSSNLKTEYNFQKIDVPVLLGKKFLRVVHIYAGPSFQYILDADFKLDEFKEIDANGFTVGLQLGAGVELGKIGVDVRWERGLSDTETKLVTTSNTNAQFDTRVNQIIFGLSYKF